MQAPAAQMPPHIRINRTLFNLTAAGYRLRHSS
jgi:hypothetical protein